MSCDSHHHHRIAVRMVRARVHADLVLSGACGRCRTSVVLSKRIRTAPMGVLMWGRAKPRATGKRPFGIPGPIRHFGFSSDIKERTPRPDIKTGKARATPGRRAGEVPVLPAAGAHRLRPGAFLNSLCTSGPQLYAYPDTQSGWPWADHWDLNKGPKVSQFKLGRLSMGTLGTKVA